jgi:uncharacterized membrane protein
MIVATSDLNIGASIAGQPSRAEPAALRDAPQPPHPPTVVAAVREIAMRTWALLAATALLLCACAREEANAVADRESAPSAAIDQAGNGGAAEDTANEADDGAEPASPAPAAAACRTQDGKPVPANRLRAIGTEPFWGAIVEGRCVTYSHPDDQQGTRVWTRFSGTAANGSWTGALRGSPFVLRTKPQPGCSDGMSDNRYPIAVTLSVGGEERTGCARQI